MVYDTNECGIEQLHTVWNHPQQNGAAEQANQTIEEHAIAMLYEANFACIIIGGSC